MIAQYNTLRNQLTGDYQAFYDKAYQYAQERHYPGFYANDILMSLLDLLITAQMNHKELDTLIKEDQNTFIKNYFHDQGKKTHGSIASLDTPSSYGTMYSILFLTQHLMQAERL